MHIRVGVPPRHAAVDSVRPLGVRNHANKHVLHGGHAKAPLGDADGGLAARQCLERVSHINVIRKVVPPRHVADGHEFAVALAAADLVAYEGVDLFLGGTAGRRVHEEAVARAVLLLEVQRGTDATQAPLYHDADARAERLGLDHAVRGDEDHAVRRAQFPDDAPHDLPVLGIEARRGLVQVQDGRRAYDGNADREAPAHAAGELPRLGGEGVAIEAHGYGHALHLRAASARVREALGAAEELKVLFHGELRPNHLELRHDAEHRAERVGLRIDVEAAHEDLARRLGEHAAEHLDRRRLAGAVGPEQREGLAEGDCQIQTAHGQEGGLLRVAGVLDHEPRDRDGRL
eukprot:CAMPEP_0118885786 /NCGR_PEP_ID=MMETSP1163-20130328/24117_1 /TAXON_ID=124430 /ORGANISM="Phaeomonas parva, Strain CCMP2877" /LENGTH=345 /DNA_ID=CAMNT_0006823857 /DNA_START=264 /DNA_END=1299 /DNA_ORIENTATION=-